MARIIYCHPALTDYGYHIYTDLDFWDARRLVKDLATVRRNFGKYVSGDNFPAQILADGLSRNKMATIERRIKRAIPSPARHVVVRCMVLEGFFEFDPSDYYPSHWSPGKMMHFTYRRLPLHQSALCTPYQTIKLSWVGEGRIRVERVQREKVYDPVIRRREEAVRRLRVPSCF